MLSVTQESNKPQHHFPGWDTPMNHVFLGSHMFIQRTTFCISILINISACTCQKENINLFQHISTKFSVPLIQTALFWFLTENSKMVELVLLDLPSSLVLERPSYISIRRYGQANTSIWRRKSNQCLLRQLFWLSSWIYRFCSSNSYCFSISICICLCIFHGKIELSEEVKVSNLIEVVIQFWSLTNSCT